MGTTPLPPPPSSSSVLNNSFSGFPTHISQFTAQKEAPPEPAAPPQSPPKTLEQFALLCVELLLPNVPPAYESPELQALMQTWLAQLQERATKYHGVVESTHQSIAFVVFPYENTVADSVEMALQLVLNLMEYPVVAPAVPNSALRFGLAIEQATARNPIAGATERTLANTNQVILGQLAMQLVSMRRYPLEALKSDSPLLRQGQYFGFTWQTYQVFRQQQSVPPFHAEVTPLASPANTNDDGFEDYSYQVYPDEPSMLPTHPSQPLHTSQPAPPPVPTHQPITHPTTVSASHTTTSTPTPPSPTVSATLPIANFQLFEQTPPLPRRSLPFLPFVQTETQEAANTSYRQVSEHLFNGIGAALTNQPEAPKLLVLKGITGIGKSSLLQMTKTQLEQQFTTATTPTNEEEPAFLWLSAGFLHSVPYPLEAWMDILRGLFHIPTEGMPADYAAQQIDQLIAYIAPPNSASEQADVAKTMKSLFGTAAPPEAPLETGNLANAIFWLLKQLIAHKPVVLVLENADTLDETSGQMLFELFQHGLLQLPQCAVVLTTTPQHQSSAWLQAVTAQYRTLSLTLATLAPQEAQEFLEAGPFLNQFNQFPATFMQQLINKAGNTPFHLEEAVRYLVLTGQLTQHPETGALAPTQWLQIPDSIETLQTLFQKRFDALTAQHQTGLTIACVLGPRFTISLFQALLQQPEEAFNETLQVLWEQGWLQPDVANLITFRHQSLYQFLRQSVSAEKRMALHGTVYETLKTGFPVETAQCDALLAYHAYQAGLLDEAIEATEQWGLRLGLLGCPQGQIQSLWQQTQWLVPQTPQNHPEILAYCQALEALAYPLQLQDPQFFAETIAYLAYQGIQQGVFALEIAKRYEWLGLLADITEQRFELRKALTFRQLAAACLPTQDYPNEKAILSILSLELLLKLGDWETINPLIETTLEPWFNQLLHSGMPFPPELLPWIGQYHRLLIITKTHWMDWQTVEHLYQRLQAVLQRFGGTLSTVEMALIQLARGRALLWQGALVPAQTVLPELETTLFTDATNPIPTGEGVSPLLLEARVEWLLLQAECSLMGHRLLGTTLPAVIQAKLPSLQTLTEELPQAYRWLELFEALTNPQHWWEVQHQLLEQQLLGVRQRFIWIGLHLHATTLLGSDACLALVNRELPITQNNTQQPIALPNTLVAWQYTLAKGELLLANGQAMEAGYWLQTYWKPVMQSNCFPFIVGMTVLVGQLNRILALGATATPQKQYYAVQAKQLLQQARILGTKMQSLPFVERIEAELHALG